MTSPTNISVAGEDGQSLEAVMAGLGAAARRAARMLARTDALEKDEALEAMAGAIEARAGDLMAANAVDVAAAQAGGMSPAFVDRLTLTPERIAAMSAGLRAVAAFNDPVGSVIAAWEQPNGLKIERVRTPLGVIGVIFESRPNVTVDAGGLCLKAGNAAILRGGSDSWHSTRAIHQCLVAGLNVAGLPEAAIQLVPTRDRDAVGMMLSGLNGAIDVIVPRGGRSLVERVQNDARVPVFAHLEGICHLYVHPSADLAMAVDLALNSKLRRTGICGALECLLIDRGCVETHLKPVVMALLDAGCEVRGDQTVQTADPRVVPAHASDWGHEFLDAVVAVKVVDNVHEACSHIESHGSAHTDAIVAEDETVAATFFEALDSAILLHNASTQFADGGEFGMGAEIGIATGKFHARGPVGVEQLTSFQYRVYGDGQTRT